MGFEFSLVSPARREIRGKHNFSVSIRQTFGMSLAYRSPYLAGPDVTNREQMQVRVSRGPYTRL